MRCMWLLMSTMLSTLCFLSAEWDIACIDNCSCCKDRLCQATQHFSNTCIKGCIDGHRGARCYELCQYSNCKSCGFNNSDTTCTVCYGGFYLGPNKDCTYQCPSNCQTCTSSTMCTVCKEGFYDKEGSTSCSYAHCPANCECNGQGDCVSCKKGYYDTSTSCTKKCPINCLTCDSFESCTECKNGFYNGHDHDNNVNLELHNCTHACRNTCTQCQSYNSCLQCIEGKYGITCHNDCSVGCKDKTCNFDFGHCKCTVNFTGNKCMKCVDGNYGLFCNETCPKYCKGKICDRKTGDCSDGCINDNISGSTCNTCIAGMFGDLCDKTCPGDCKGIRCERYSGVCSDGCTQNFKGTKCDLCIPGKYGKKCNLNCPVHCLGNVCEKLSGTCFDCVGNFQGTMCDVCKPGFYGPNCDAPCSVHCANYPCHRNTGNCVYGCKNGYSGDKCCVMSENCVECHSNTECRKCVPGFFKSSCKETCPGGCNSSCYISTGECIPGSEAKEQKDAPNSGPVAAAVVLGSMFTLLFAANIVLLALVLLKKIKVSRRKNNQAEREPTYENQLKSVGEQFQRRTCDVTDTLHPDAVERNVYEGFACVNGNLQGTIQMQTKKPL